MRSGVQLGIDGEDAVARHYERLGYQVVERRWRCRSGELDLVVRRGGTVVFCEVKTRRGRSHGSGADAVDARKQSQVRRVAVAWLHEHGGGIDELRFDVASVDYDGRAFAVRLIEGAF